MHVELKVSLATRADYDRVLSALSSGGILRTQTSHFFDGTHNELTGSDAILRVRHDDAPTLSPTGALVEKATLCLKEHNEVEGGNCVRFQYENDLPLPLAKAAVRDPTALLSFATDPSRAPAVAPPLSNILGPSGLLRYVASFRTERLMIPNWQLSPTLGGLTFRLDRTSYPFGDRFEIEIGDIGVPLDDVAAELGQRLTVMGVAFSLASHSKYMTLVRGMQQADSNTCVDKPKLCCDLKLSLDTNDDAEILRFNLSAQHIGPPESYTDHFWDGSEQELSQAGCYLKLRIKPDHAILSLKQFSANSAIAADDNGLAVFWSHEERVSSSNVAGFLENIVAALNRHEAQNAHTGSSVAQTRTSIFRMLRDRGVKSLTYIGGFSTTREVFRWASATAQPGLNIRVDVTNYPFGPRAEVEVPGITVPVQDVQDELFSVLESIGVKASVEHRSKFAQLVEGRQHSAAVNAGLGA